MTIDLEDITHPSTVQALAYAMDYHTNHFSPDYPPHTYHRYDHSEHIEVLASWGYQGYFFVQSRIKLTVIYGLVANWTDEKAMRAWILWRNPITENWHVEVESHETSVHHWQDAHQYHKQEETQMALKRARIDTYYPATHTADVTIYPLPGEQLEGVPLSQEIGPELATLLPNCALAIFYDTEPPSPYITALLDGVPDPWITSALVKDGEIAIADLAFDPATQAELNTHAGLPSDHHEQFTPAEHDARDHTPIAPTVALAELGSKTHAELTAVTSGQHHQQFTPGEHDARDHTPIAPTVQLSELGAKPHSQLTGVTSDLHHPQAHTLASHSTKPHSALTGVSADQHHAQNHKARHEPGGADMLTYLTSSIINLIYLQVHVTVQQSTGSTSPVDLPGAAISVPGSGKLVIMFTGDSWNNSAGKGVWISLWRDAVQVGQSRLAGGSGGPANYVAPIHIYIVDDKVAAGAQTYKIKFNAHAGGTAYIHRANLTILRFKT